jgi:acetyltransferase-like isoleucine patch superfamily enzyme
VLSERNETIFSFSFPGISFGNRVQVLLQDGQCAHVLSSLKSCGQNVRLSMPASIFNAENIQVGDDVNIAPYVHMWGLGGIRIGSRVMIGSHVEIASTGHDFYKRTMKGTRLRRQVIIEDDVWISSHCVILLGVTIGEGALVGAGSVVTTNVKPYSVVVTGRQREEWRRPLVGERREDGGKPPV